MKRLCSTLTMLFISFFMFSITLPDGTEARLVDVMQKNGSIINATLLDKINIQTPSGVLCVKDKISFYESGTICDITLANFSRVIIGYDVYNNIDKVSFYESGAVKYLSSSINSIKVENVRYGDLFSNGVWLYADGSLRQINIEKQDIEIETSFGKILSKGFISFYKSGNVESLEPSVNQVIETYFGLVTIEQGEKIAFYEDGSIKELPLRNVTVMTLEANGSIDSINSNGSKYDSVKIRFNKEGVVSSLVLDSVSEIKADTFHKKKSISGVLLLENGSVIDFNKIFTKE